MKYAKAEIAEAIAHLRDYLKPGDTVYTVLRHVSSSGMTRHIDCYKLGAAGESPAYLTGWIAKALGLSRAKRGDALVVSGCGMDMGFHVVYNLSYVLNRDGFGCIGQGCPSNDHSNGDRGYTPHGPRDEHGRPEDREPGPGEALDGLKRHWHRDGGYALKQRWL
jgi:hypothetical protein